MPDKEPWLDTVQQVRRGEETPFAQLSIAALSLDVPMNTLTHSYLILLILVLNKHQRQCHSYWDAWRETRFEASFGDCLTVYRHRCLSAVFYFFRSRAFFRPLVDFMLMSSSSSSRRSIWLLPQLLTTRANKTVDCRLTLGYHQSLSLCTSSFSISRISIDLIRLYLARSLATFLFAATACSLYHISIYEIGSSSYFCVEPFTHSWLLVRLLTSCIFLSFDLTSAQCIQNI